MTEKMTCAHCVKDFLSHYYTTLCQEPHNLHRFYGPKSSFKHGCLDTNGMPVEAVAGQVNIHEKIMALGFQNCHSRIRSITAQDTFCNSVTVLVTGDLSINEQPKRGFIQLLVLAPAAGNTKYIYSDVLQYQDEVFGNPELAVDFTEKKADICSEPQPVAEEPSVMNPTPSPAANADPNPSVLVNGQGVEQTEDERDASSEVPNVDAAAVTASTEPHSMEKKADIPLEPHTAEDASSCAPNNLPLSDTSVSSEAGIEGCPTLDSTVKKEKTKRSTKPVQKVKTEIFQEHRAAEESSDPTSPSTMEGSPTLDSTVKKQKTKKGPKPVQKGKMVGESKTQLMEVTTEKSSPQTSRAVVASRVLPPSTLDSTVQPETESGPKPVQEGKIVGKSETQSMEVTTEKSSPQMSWAAVASRVPPPNVAVKSTPRIVVAPQPKHKNSRPAQVKLCMFVGSIPTDVEATELKEFFEQYGSVLNVRIRPGKNSRSNFGFVEFEDSELARSIIDCEYVKFRPKIYLKVGEDRAIHREHPIRVR